jgi:hypothetical protein
MEQLHDDKKEQKSIQHNNYFDNVDHNAHHSTSHFNSRPGPYDRSMPSTANTDIQPNEIYQEQKSPSNSISNSNSYIPSRSGFNNFDRDRDQHRAPHHDRDRVRDSNIDPSSSFSRSPYVPSNSHLSNSYVQNDSPNLTPRIYEKNGKTLYNGFSI